MHAAPPQPWVTAPIDSKDTNRRWARTFAVGTTYGVVEVSTKTENAFETGVTVLSGIRHDGIATVRDLEEWAYSAFDENVSSLSVVHIAGTKVFMTVIGGGAIFLRRGNHISCILNGQGSASGEIRQTDQVLCLSGSLSRKSDLDVDLQRWTQGVEPFVRYLQKRVFGDDTLTGCSGFLLWQGEALSDAVPLQIHERHDDDVLPRPPERKFHRFASYYRQGALRIRLFAGKARWGLREFSQRKTWRWVGIAGTVAVFVVSVGFGLLREFGNPQVRETKQLIAEVRALTDEGVALIDLNSVQAKEKLAAAEALALTGLSTTSGMTEEGQLLRKLLNEIQTQLVLAKQVYQVTPELFYDVAILKNGVGVKLMSLSGSTLYLAGSDNGIVTLDLETKRAEAWPVHREATIQQIAAGDREIFALTERGVEGINSSGAKTVITRSPDWGDIAAMQWYAGNVYLTDAIHNRIWKYTRAEDGSFSPIQEYLNPDSFPDLSGAASLHIDGNVWVGKRDGSILRFSLGAESTFTIRGVDPVLAGQIEPFISDETDYLYILDKERSRIVRLSKDGEYQGQFLWSGLNVSAIAVAEQLRRQVLLSDGKIYTVSMK